ncbi:tigger transposable element-derived protein 4-like [Ischnura elegans]|uniref:tigger transposable element-derived protein 4-like n=1 Tax=Ischnura elegans TaxID=197161 RepID=UPI001ED8B250|nr:tigger transposable element-derived protein 4-like [Ischnura elegans]
MEPSKVKRTRKTLSIEKKIKIINDMERNKSLSKTEIAKLNGISLSTLKTILASKEKLFSASCHTKSSYVSSGKYAELEDTLFSFFSDCRQNKLPVDGAILKEKARNLALTLGHQDFKCSTGWLDNFKKRYNISYQRECGEEGKVDDNLVSKWHQINDSIIESFAPRDRYNMDETGLFWKALPDRTMHHKGKKCHGAQRSKERLTVVLTTNQDGSDKLKPVVIGKALKPRCFKNIGKFSLPVKYHANKHAWMSVELFRQQVLYLERKCAGENRNVLLIIDNAPVHKVDGLELKNVKLLFLEPNTTSKTQPLDKGIIQNFKIMYRSYLLQHFIRNIDNGANISEAAPWTLLHAVRSIARAWNNVSKETIKNCWRSAGYGDVEDNVAEETISTPPSLQDLLANELEQFNQVCPINSSVSSIAYNEIDEDLATNEETVSAELNYTPAMELEEESDVMDDSDAVPVHPSRSDIKEAFRHLHNFCYAHSEISEGHIENINALEALVNKIFEKGLQQSKIQDYFHPK